MIVYLYDADTKIYKGRHKCQPDPLEGGYLYPPDCTEIAPPEPKKNKTLRFNKKKKAWVEKDDFTGEKIWDKKTGEMKVSETADIPKGYTIESPSTEFDEWNAKKAAWVTNTKKQKEAKWEAIRNKRNNLLLESDWTQLPDAGLPEKEAVKYKKYRQALRDITKTFDDPDKVIWPVKI